MNAQTPVTADPISQLEASLATALPLLEGAKKNAANAAFKQGNKVSKYADLGAVIDAIRPIAEHGIWYRQVLHESADGVTIETLYTGFGATISAGTLFMPADKRNAQGYGSALTYARRYALQTAFGLSTEDDDGNAASEPRQTSAVSPPATINDDQHTKLELMLPAAKVKPAQFNQKFGINRTNELPADRYDEAIQSLKDRMAELAKNATNAKAQENA